MDTVQIISLIANVVLGSATLYLMHRGNTINKLNAQLEGTVRQLRLFDQDTALTMFLAARNHEEQAWNLRRTLQANLEQGTPVNADLIGWAGNVHGESEEIARTMIRVYRLSGAVPTESQVDSWIRDGLIPPHYKKWFLSYVRE